MIPRSNVLGVGVSATNMTHATEEVCRWISGGLHHYICVAGVHGVMECQRDPALKRIHNRAGLVLPDGMPLAWWVRWQHRGADRVCGPEFMPHFIEQSQSRGYRHFFYGASQQTLDDLRKVIAERYPKACIAGSYSPPYRALTPAEDAAIVAAINAANPDIIWVGLSTPKQERWMGEHRGSVTAPVLVGVGAAFDMLAGRVRRAPKFLRRSGLEWTFRLMIEPRRLWRRYLFNIPAFLVLAAAQVMGFAKFFLDPPPEPGGIA